MSSDGLFDELVARNQLLEEFVCNAIQYEDNGKCNVAKMADVILGLPKLKVCSIFADNRDRVPDETRKKLQEVVRPHWHRQLVVEMLGCSYLL